MPVFQDPANIANEQEVPQWLLRSWLLRAWIHSKLNPPQSDSRGRAKLTSPAQRKKKMSGFATLRTFFASKILTRFHNVPQCSTYVLCVTQVQAQTSYLFCFLRCRHQATCQLFGINTGRQPKVKPESLGTFRKWLRRDWVPNGPNLPPFTSWKDQGRSRLHCSAWRAGNSWKF